MPSNKLIIRGERVALPERLQDLGVTASNYFDDMEPHLANARRKKALTNIVIHETGGNSASGCKKTLVKKDLGIHLIVDKDGHISCHADLATEVCWHANQMNLCSIGIEVVNAYTPTIATQPHGEVIPAKWWTWVPPGAPREYVTPTVAQSVVCDVLVPWLCVSLDIPFILPTRDLDAKKPQITGWKKPPLGWNAKPGPGVVAHRDFSSHSDGRYILERLGANLA